MCSYSLKVYFCAAPLNAGEIAGIVVGCVAAVIIIAAVVLIIVRWGSKGRPCSKSVL